MTWPIPASRRTGTAHWPPGLRSCSMLYSPSWGLGTCVSLFESHLSPQMDGKTENAAFSDSCLQAGSQGGILGFVLLPCPAIVVSRALFVAAVLAACQHVHAPTLLQRAGEAPCRVSMLANNAPASTGATRACAVQQLAVMLPEHRPAWNVGASAAAKQAHYGCGAASAGSAHNCLPTCAQRLRATQYGVFCNAERVERASSLFGLRVHALGGKASSIPLPRQGPRHSLIWCGKSLPLKMASKCSLLLQARLLHQLISCEPPLN